VKSCAIGSSIGGIALSVVLAIGACHSTPTPADIPPVTSARVSDDVPISSDGPNAAAAATAVVDAAPSTTPAALIDGADAWKPTVTLRDTPWRIEEGACARVLLAVAKGAFTIAGEGLASGDVLVLTKPAASEVKGAGLVVEARHTMNTCPAAPEKTVVRANAAQKLEWAGGKMSARLDVGTKISPELYLGRLEGTAAVAEHVHAAQWEVLVAVEAAGTFTLDGKEQRLGPRQVVFVPPNTKHSWKPDPGSKLVAVQMYSPPGPEQRFVGLAAAEKDAGKP
jgi:mannose-6-phosphate isomerase-like protein (cupin superfamily)